MVLNAKGQENKDTKNILIVVIITGIAIIALILCFTVDIGVLYEVSQHPEYFYVSEVIGLSMYPQVYTGDMFIVQTVDHPGFMVDIGDILIFGNGNNAIGHRVLEIHPDYYVTRGDNNGAGEMVYPSQVIGKVVKTIDRYNPIGQYMFNLVAD